ncbi:LOW QUALITY PROTEIN: hypothetical protein HID58_080905, partial [Brassica napus]
PQTGVPTSITQPSSLSVLVLVSIAFGFLRLWDSLNFKKDMEFVGITVLFLDEKLSPKDCIDYGFLEEKDLAPEKRRQPCCKLLNSPFQAEQQMEANLSGSSSTSRQNQKIDVGGRLIKGLLRRSETA